MQPPKKPCSQLMPEGTVRCVWMDAGLLKWKLCDRHLECETCPLDAALRGLPPETTFEGASGRRRPPWLFPDDRRYAGGHVWVQVVEPRKLRLGLDTLAADLLPAPRAILLPETGRTLVRDEDGVHVTVEGGEVSLRVPVSGRVLRRNDLVSCAPANAVRRPYTDGWLLELDPGDAPPAQELDALMNGGEMRRQARIDVQRLQRRVAMEVLMNRPAVGPAMADGGEPVTELRLMLTPERYVELVQELLR